MLAYMILEHLVSQWKSRRNVQKICDHRIQAGTFDFKRGYDSPELYEVDMRLRVGLPETESFPEDEECE